MKRSLPRPRFNLMTKQYRAQFSPQLMAPRKRAEPAFVLMLLRCLLLIQKERHQLLPFMPRLLLLDQRLKLCVNKEKSPRLHSTLPRWLLTLQLSARLPRRLLLKSFLSHYGIPHEQYLQSLDETCKQKASQSPLALVMEMMSKQLTPKALRFQF